MLLRLIRFDLLISLLVCLVHVGALEEIPQVSSLTPNPLAMPLHEMSSSRFNHKRSPDVPLYSQSDFGGFVGQINLKSKPHHRRDTRRHSYERHIPKKIVSSQSYASPRLAEKLAQEALSSKEMQNTIEKLTSLKSEHKKHGGGKHSSVGHAAKTLHSRKDHVPSKAGRKGNHTKQRKRGPKHKRPQYGSKRHRSKKESQKTARERKRGMFVRKGRRRGHKRKCKSEESVPWRRRRMRKDLDQTTNPNFIKKRSNFQSMDEKCKRDDGKGDEEVRKNSMIAQLMRTTTRDPTKKSPGDQGVEYSEYYSDNDNAMLPEKIGDQLKLDEMAINLVGGRSRSVREAADDSVLDQEYYGSPNDHMLQLEDDVRPKRNDQRSVKVVQAPLSSLDYVDSSDGPNGIIGTEKNPRYFNDYNYNPDPGGQLRAEAYHLVNNIPVEVNSGPGRAAPNQFSPDVPVMFPGNLPIPESLPNVALSNMLPVMGNEFNSNLVTPERPDVLGNVVLSQFPQQDLAKSNQLSFYSANGIPLSNIVSSSTNSVGFYTTTSPEQTIENSRDINANAADDKKRSTSSVGTSGVMSSSLSSRMSYSPIDGDGRVSFQSPELFPRLRDVRPKVGAPKSTYLNWNDGVGNHVENVASRAIGPQRSKAEASKTKVTGSTKIDVQATTLQPDLKDSKNHRTNETGKGVHNNSLATTTTKTSAPVNVTHVGNETKAVASEILNEIMEELEELRLENPKNEQREGLPCKLTGSWVTARAGVRIDMKVTNHSIQVSLDYLTPPIITEGLLNVTWNVTGFAPFKRGGPFTLLATNNHTKTLAVFVGACKVCQGIDTIEGSWTVSREPRDCRDFQMSINIFNEIFRRTRLYSAIKDKQTKREEETSVGTTMAISSSGSSSTSESAVSVTLHYVPVNLSKSHNLTLGFNATE